MRLCGLRCVVGSGRSRVNVGECAGSGEQYKQEEPPGLSSPGRTGVDLTVDRFLDRCRRRNLEVFE